MFIIILFVLQTLDIGDAKRQINKVADLIYQRYEYHNKEWRQFFLGASNMPDFAWVIIVIINIIIITVSIVIFVFESIFLI